MPGRKLGSLQSCSLYYSVEEKKGETDRTEPEQLNSLLRPVSPIQVLLAATGFVLDSDSSCRGEDTRGPIWYFSYSILFRLFSQLGPVLRCQVVRMLMASAILPRVWSVTTRRYCGEW